MHDSSLEAKHAPYLGLTTAVLRLWGLSDIGQMIMEVSPPPPTTSTWCHSEKGELVR